MEAQQDESGQASAPITLQNANPTIELQRATTTTSQPGLGAPMTCKGCFGSLNAAQVSEFEDQLQDNSNEAFGQSVTTIEELCTFLENELGFGVDITPYIEAVGNFLGNVEGLSSATISDITNCLTSAAAGP